MERKKDKVLGCILVFSILGNIILANQFFKVKETFIGLEEQLNDSKFQLKNAQIDWNTLQVNKVDAQKEDIQVVNTSSASPSDPYKKLKSGLTLWEAKLQFEKAKEGMKKAGISDNTIKEYLDEEAKALGTTVDELACLPAELPVPPKPEPKAEPKTQPKAEKPAPQQKQNNNSTKPSNNGGGQTNPGGDSGNGDVDPAFKGHESKTSGYTPYDGPGLGDGN